MSKKVASTTPDGSPKRALQENTEDEVDLLQVRASTSCGLIHSPPHRNMHAGDSLSGGLRTSWRPRSADGPRPRKANHYRKRSLASGDGTTNWSGRGLWKDAAGANHLRPPSSPARCALAKTSMLAFSAYWADCDCSFGMKNYDSSTFVSSQLSTPIYISFPKFYNTYFIKYWEIQNEVIYIFIC